MTCLELRDRLAESALGVLDCGDEVELERHLAWCAGCRKESAELGSAAQLFGYAVAPAAPPAALEDGVVSVVGAAATGPSARRRGHAAAVSIVAALVAISGLGWGAAMAGRAERFAERAAQAEASKQQQLDQFRKVLSSVIPGARIATDQTHLAQLAPPPTGQGVGGGAALELISPTTMDFVIVRVAGLDPTDASAMPYRVTVANAGGRVLRIGTIRSLDADGTADVFHQYRFDLTGFTDVRVTDAGGHVVLRGTIDQSS
jgi:hypothetical protein